jgi:hypothetical protein
VHSRACRVTDYKRTKDARAVGVMPAERDWNDVVDLKLDGSEASREGMLGAVTPLRRLPWRAQVGARSETSADGQRNDQEAAKRKRDSASASMSPGSARPPMASGSSGRNSIRRRKSRDLSTRTAKGTKPTRR